MVSVLSGCPGCCCSVFEGTAEAGGRWGSDPALLEHEADDVAVADLHVLDDLGL